MNDQRALIGFGQVRHVRRRPAVHAFHYGAYFLMLPMRSIQNQNTAKDSDTGDLAINRAALLSFHDVDHGDGRLPEQGGALGWLSEMLEKEGIQDANGEIYMLNLGNGKVYTLAKK